MASTIPGDSGVNAETSDEGTDSSPISCISERKTVGLKSCRHAVEHVLPVSVMVQTDTQLLWSDLSGLGVSIDGAAKGLSIPDPAAVLKHVSGDKREASYISVGQCFQPEDVASPVLVSSTHVRALLQQCTSAKLAIDEAQDPATVQVERGMIVYICFLKGASMADIEKMAKLLLSVKLCANNDSKLMSVMDLPGDMLIIPQATLGGTVKGKVMQYHKNVAKEEGQHLYAEFVSIIEKAFESNKKCSAAKKIVRYGTYGIRQVFSCTTNGPFTHLIEV